STGDVDAHEVDNDKRQADGEAGETGRRERMRNAENADKEQESAHDLEDEGRDDVVLAEVARPPAVLPESARPALRFAGQDEIEHGRSDDRAKDLCDPVADHLGVGAQPEIGGQRWPSRRFQASLRETGMPRAVMRLRTLQPTLASTFCAGRVRARSVRPMMVL